MDLFNPLKYAEWILRLSLPKKIFDLDEKCCVHYVVTLNNLFQVELDHKLKPFIPDFIPAVGDIDAFITVPRPDNKVDKLGLACIDEPCAKQSDPTVLDLQIRAITKQTHFRAMQVPVN